MNEKDFLENYLWPSGNRLDKTFTHTLPDIEGLKRVGDLIVQCEHEDTFSTNIMTKFESDVSGVRLIDVSKNTQNNVTGVFVRLVGTMSIVKSGYPLLILDAPISNVPLRITDEQKEGTTTTVFILLGQADPEQRKIFFDRLREQAKEAGIPHQERDLDYTPNFWGTVWETKTNGIDLNTIQKLRDAAWKSYKSVMEQTMGKASLDYRPLQQYMIFDTSKREHLSFGSKGLSVPVEAQAAFFSVMVSGV
jgi:hypothetical protein